MPCLVFYEFFVFAFNFKATELKLSEKVLKKIQQTKNRIFSKAIL